jgi:hypothetical protein
MNEEKKEETMGWEKFLKNWTWGKAGVLTNACFPQYVSHKVYWESFVRKDWTKDLKTKREEEQQKKNHKKGY